MTLCTYLPSWVARGIASALATVFLIVQFGCATRPPSVDLHWQLRNEVTALIPARLQTELSLVPFAVGRPSGALEGAGMGFVGCLQGWGGHCSGSMCGAALLIILGVAVTCSAVGAVAGAIQATPADEAGTMVDAIDEVTRQLASHLNLTRKVLARAGEVDGLTVALVDEEELAWMEEPDRWRAVQSRGFVNALEVGVTEIEFIGGSGSDPELVLHMVARARLIDLATGKEKYREEFHSAASSRRYSQWAANQGALMKSAVEQGLESLGADIGTKLFEQVALPFPSGAGALPWSDEFGCCWLCPQSPPHDLSHKPWKGLVEVKYLPVSSWQPELVWESFPRAGQEAGLREVSGKEAPEVRYDLRIWEVYNQKPGPLVYERQGLNAPRHRLEAPLKQGYRYFWSFRACFDAEQGELCTPWAFSSVPARSSCELPSIPAENYYRFVVP